jgi:hypothetical protein
VSEVSPGVFQGYSGKLNLILRAGDRYLGWHDPATGERIPTREAETARASAVSARAGRERAARIRAETRTRGLEAELHRLRESRQR